MVAWLRDDHSGQEFMVKARPGEFFLAEGTLHQWMLRGMNVAGYILLTHQCRIIDAHFLALFGE